SGATAHVDDLARQCEANPDALYRVLRALASLGVFREEEGRRFAHTPLSEALRSDVPGSTRGLAQMTLMLHLRAWPSIEQSLRTGGTAFKHAFGDEIFDYLEKTPEAARVFDVAFGGYTAMVSRAVAESHDFSRFERIVDVGGGGGALIAA